MFFCRHQLLRAPAQRHFTSLLTKRHAARIPVHEGPALHHARPTSSSTIVHDAPTDSTNTSTTDSHIRRSGTSTRTIEKQHHEGHHSTHYRMSDDEFKKRPIPYYFLLRKHGPLGLKQMSLKRFDLVIRDALQSHRSEPDIFSDLVQDAIHICENQSPLTGRLVIVLILRKLGIARAITKDQIVQLLRTLEAHDGLRFVPAHSRVFIARAAVAYPPDQAIDRELFTLLAPWLLQALPEEPVLSKGKYPGAWEQSSTGILVPRVLWAMYRGVLALAQDGRQSEASALLSKLVAGEHISNDAINATDLSSKDHVYIILSVLIRTCLAHGWTARASELLMPEVSARTLISLPLAQLTEDWVAATLSDPHEEDLRPAASGLILLFQRADNFVVSGSVLQGFYDAAFRAKMPEIVEAVYTAARKFKDVHSYPPPRGQTLLSFLQYLQHNSRNVHLARLLVQQIVEEEKTPLPPSTRASIIGIAAVLGFTSYARALWERYSTGPDRLYVVGRRFAMLRVVSAFVKAEAIAIRTLRSRWPNEPLPDAYRRNQREDGEAAERADDQEEEDVKAASSETGSEPEPELDVRAREEDDDPASADTPHPPSPPPPRGDAKVVSGLPSGGAGADLPAPEPVSEAEEDEDGTSGRRWRGFAALTRTELLERASELRRFAERVFDAYVESKRPLEAADHYGLNALARGAFMLGRDQLAFEVFAKMRARGIKLDMYDLNVALSVVAKADPAAGAERIRRMVESGFKPDAVTFGTVIHWAIFHGDAPLVGEVVRQARASGLENFSFKTMGSLLHATVSSQFTGELAGGSPGAQLDNARDVVDTMLDAGILPTANMGRDCVLAALRAEDPVMAFGFWKQLVRGKVQFTDPAQVALRRRIARLVREHGAHGWLDEERARAMVSELGFDAGFALSVHVRRRWAARGIDEGAR